MIFATKQYVEVSFGMDVCFLFYSISFGLSMIAIAIFYLAGKIK